jgi:hypothetical protein
MGSERCVRVSDLVGASDIAERLDLAQTQTVHTLRNRHADFPKPIAQLKTAYIWAWPDVEAWARRTGRLPVDDG